MNRLFFFGKKPERSHRPSQQHISLGIPTNVAVGPVGFKAELDTGSIRERCRSPYDLEVDRPDATVTLDENDTRASRIVSRDTKSGGGGPPAPETSIAGTMIGDDKHGNGERL